jgi:hypothetical protein
MIERFRAKTTSTSSAGSTGMMSARENSCWSSVKPYPSFSVWLIRISSRSSPTHTIERSLTSPTPILRSGRSLSSMISSTRSPRMVVTAARRVPLNESAMSSTSGSAP